MLNVCLPGTGGVVPLKNRFLTCCWVEYEGSAVLIDCGEGTQIALQNTACKLSHLDTLLFTHFHADHVAGLPGLLLSLGNQGKTTPLAIIGPVGLSQVVACLTVIAPVLPYPIKLYEIKENAAGECSLNGIDISFLPVNHGISCFGYRISVKRKPIFNPAKAEALGVPKPLFKVLHAGNSVRLEDGREVRPSAVLDGERAPLSVCYITDTLPTENMTRFAWKADLLVSEGMYGDDSMREKMGEKGHMLFSDSARIARDSGVKRLWLTHYSPAMAEPAAFVEAAREIFPETYAAYDGMTCSL